MTITLNKKQIIVSLFLLFFYIIAWQFGLIIYALLLTVPVIVAHYKYPALEFRKAVLLGFILCAIWYASNAVAFVSLAPISDIGFSKVLKDILLDLIKTPCIVGLAFSYNLYKTRLLISLFGVTVSFYALANIPFGRDLGLHRIFELPGGLTLASSHSLGSSRWSTEQELRNYFASSGPGLILGKNSSDTPYILSDKEVSFEYQRNQHILVFGATGSGKSASFVKPNVMQADTSFMITDPKQEIYAELAPFLRSRGYKVYMFNLADMQNSNCWNPLVKKDGTCNLSIQDAVLMSSSIIKNTKGPFEKTGEPFWDKSEQALLTALMIYASNHMEHKTFSDILRFATGRTPAALDYDFGLLPNTDPARAAYNIYAQAPEKVRSSIIISLGTRLQLFQDDKLANITSRSDFDMTDLGDSRTAIFVAISDYDETYHSISALFFTQAFQELYRSASASDGKLEVPVRFIMDEFCNIGFIPGYTTKLSTMRSRGISAQMIVQSLGQLQNRYPFGLADEIIGNCDTRLMLGANDVETAKYFVDLLGRSTILQEIRSHSDRLVVDAGNIAKREVARELLTVDEILRLQNDRCILVIRGTHPALIYKLYYLDHPSASELKIKPEPSGPASDQISTDLATEIEGAVSPDNSTVLPDGPPSPEQAEPLPDDNPDLGEIFQP